MLLSVSPSFPWTENEKNASPFISHLLSFPPCPLNLLFLTKKPQIVMSSHREDTATFSKICLSGLQIFFETHYWEWYTQRPLQNLEAWSGWWNMHCDVVMHVVSFISPCPHSTDALGIASSEDSLMHTYSMKKVGSFLWMATIRREELPKKTTTPIYPSWSNRGVLAVSAPVPIFLSILVNKFGSVPLNSARLVGILYLFRVSLLHSVTHIC